MTAALTDAMISLTALMEEESEQLARSPLLRGHAEIADAKQRLAGRIEAEISRLGRETPDWMEALAPGDRAALADISRGLRDAATINARILARQIELSSEMMAAIAAEAQRVTGSRSTTYAACGAVAGVDAPAPISINARL